VVSPITDAELVDLLREEYWRMGTTGCEAMAYLWSEMSENRSGFRDFMDQHDITEQTLVRAVSLLGEWLTINELLYKSPMEQSMEIRAEKLKFPEGPR
jgi:hypothetical protein